METNLEITLRMSDPNSFSVEVFHPESSDCISKEFPFDIMPGDFNQWIGCEVFSWVYDMEDTIRDNYKLTKDKFFEEFACFNNTYSTYLIMNKSTDEVINMLNDMGFNPDDIGNGCETEHGVSFVICKGNPEYIYDFTKRLNTRGYADTDWDDTYTECAENGEWFDNFKAEWTDGHPHLMDDEEWENVFVTITDIETGERFYTGTGMGGDVTFRYYNNMINRH